MPKNNLSTTDIGFLIQPIMIKPINAEINKVLFLYHVYFQISNKQPKFQRKSNKITLILLAWRNNNV